VQVAAQRAFIGRLMLTVLGGEAQADVARSFNVSQATISRLAAPSPFEASAVGL
jgi:hypothetical protein